MEGWIADHRKELKSDIWLMPPMYHRVWQAIKYSVNCSPAKIPNRDGTFTELLPGQHATSYRILAEKVGYYEGKKWKTPNVKTIKQILDWLVKQNMISVWGNTSGTIITVENWEVYQFSEAKGNTKRITVETLDGSLCKHFVDTNNKKEQELTKINKNKKEELIKPLVIMTDDEIDPLPEVAEPEERIDYKLFVGYFNSICKSFNRVTKLTEGRKRAIRSALKNYGEENVKRAFLIAEESDYLSGRNGKWDNCCFDWILKPANLIKILEGNYTSKNKTDYKTDQFKKSAESGAIARFLARKDGEDE